MFNPFKVKGLYLCIYLVLLGSAPILKAQNTNSDTFLSNLTETNISQVINLALDSDLGFNRLTHLGDYYGPRLSGSKQLEDAIDWAVTEMTNDGFDRVWKQDVMVPHWVRGNEFARISSPISRNLPMLGLGGSIGTNGEVLAGEIVVVHSFEELEERKNEVQGNIVLFNVPFTTYGQTVSYRVNGAIEAAKHGAIASIIASVASYSIQTPHTGVMYYEDGVPKIPHAAITVEDANLIDRFIQRGETVRFELYMEAETKEDALSHNVIAEYQGTELPDEIIVLGGHIDSWDVGQGVMDDGGGCIAAWEAVRLLIENGIRPKRTIRVVLWTNEENGLRGANEYARWVQEDEKSLEKHVIAMESDAGVFDPLGFGFSGTDTAYDQLTEIAQLLESIEANELRKGGGGADIGPLMNKGVPGMGLNVDGEKYFWFHHTDGDTIEKLNQEDFNECVATMAAYALGIADAQVTLDR
ncbi:MAG: peptidase M28 family protein [Bacteroidetes bacterium]|nr:peptidase M28 family protein [Bacteroidota bacterium]